MELKDCTVLVTPTSFGKTNPELIKTLEAKVGKVIVNTLGRSLNSAEVSALIVDCDGYIAGLDQIDRIALLNANRLKVISRYGVGVDNVDINFAKQNGIVVTNTPGANSIAVAELTLGLILSLARSIPKASVETRSGNWPRLSGLSIEGKTIGIIGLGSIGKQVARRLLGFDCHLLAYDPIPDMAFAVEYDINLTSLDFLIKESDFITLHVPLLSETRGLVNNTFLNKMKRGSFLINTSRGELVDENALCEAIQRGHLRGAAIDVFTKEPPDDNHPLLHLPQVIVTPHCGAHTDGAMNAMGWMSLYDCLAVLSGQKPKFPVI